MIEKWRGKRGEEKKEEGENTADLIYHEKVIEPPFLIRKFGVSEEEYDQLTDEDTKADLFDGTLIIHSSASIRHESIFMFMAFLMHGYVEHLSGWTRDYELREKRQVYHEAGIDEIWFIDAEEQVITADRRRSEEKRYATTTTTSGRLESDAMQGFFVQAEWLWQEILPDPFLCLQEILIK
ncbi:MAG: Uma2 family endonuclease [Methanophagales archaeon]|nr:Uma2 family endonuclease [Methanophagales archaeon]